MSHLDAGLIHELVDGEVPSARLAPIQQHLAACSACQAKLDEARSAAAGVDALLEALDEPAAAPRAITPAGVRRSPAWWGRRLGLAASLLIAVGLGYQARGFVAPPPAATSGDSVEDRGRRSEAADAPMMEGPVVAAESPPPAPTRPPLVETQTKARARPESALERDAVNERQDIAQAPAREDARTEEAVAPRVAAAAPAPAVGRAQTAGGVASGVIGGTGPVLPLSARDQQLNAAKSFAAPSVIDLAEAMTRLGGTIRLVDGLVPLRLEAVGNEVRVVYLTTEGHLVLSQERVGSELRWSLTAPEGFPAESLATLRARVRP